MKSFVIKSESDISRAFQYIKSLNFKKVWVFDIKEYKPNRSAAQNRIYWKWIQIMGDDLGYSKDELHAVMAVKFLGVVNIEAMGENITQPVSTSTLNTKAFAEYLNRIEMFAGSELGIRLPNNDDLYFEAMGIKRVAGLKEGEGYEKETKEKE